MKLRVFCSFCLLMLLFFNRLVQAEGAAGGGRGGPFVAIHTEPLTSFDSEVSGVPMVIGGVGLGTAAKNFRIGGGGGGGFLLNPSENIHFGMGYGGAVGEYTLANWLSARLLIGGGGYAIAKTISETDTQRVLRKLSSGGFVLFYPSLSAEIPVSNSVRLLLNAGYFLPNVGKLQSFTMGANVLFGRM